jgi:DNA repair exonuclease SbcCD nuclease subunit
MKIAICSDLHLEFGDLVLKNTDGVDVLILSGDILVERDLDMFDRRQVELGFMRARSQRFHEFFERICQEFPHVLYVMGNHEHYHGDFKYTAAELKRKLAHYTNLHVLERDTFELDDVVFVGSTLWTDMNKEDPITLHAMKRMMNDFRCVQNSNKQVSFRADVLKDKPTGMTDEEFLMLPTSERFKSVFKTRTATFSPEDAVEEHRKNLDYIKMIYELTPPWKSVVVVGHHTPSHTSCHPRYKDDQVMNGGYHSDLSEFILDRPGIKLWTHGHTHEHFDYMIGDTRIVCNPRGYIGHEEIADEFTLKVVEV